MAKITVRRESGGGLLGLPVEIDGDRIGRVRPKNEISHEVTPGRHVVIVKRVPAKVTAEVDVVEGDDIRLVCSEDDGFNRKGRPSPTKVGRALFTPEGGLKMSFDGEPPEA